MQTQGQTENLRKGSRGEDVRELQQKLVRLGFDIQPDGIFGEATDTVVRKLQSMFGYTVDGIAGAGTMQLIEAQMGYGWSVKLPNAQELARQAQGKAAAQDRPNPSAGQGGSMPGKSQQGSMPGKPQQQGSMPGKPPGAMPGKPPPPPKR
jgi:peptidoglycan hydrolase-like protein with peptidoglycan-binding domain